MTGTNCDLFTHNQSRSYLNHLVWACSFQPFKNPNVHYQVQNSPPALPLPSDVTSTHAIPIINFNIAPPPTIYFTAFQVVSALQVTLIQTKKNLTLWINMSENLRCRNLSYWIWTKSMQRYTRYSPTCKEMSVEVKKLDLIVVKYRCKPLIWTKNPLIQ